MHDPKHRHVVLPDGRKLGYAEYGAPDGTPVLFFHGAPGSRHIHADMADIAAQRNVRLIAVERPGYGLSDAKRGPHDCWILRMMSRSWWMRWVYDSLRLSVFLAGSRYALACAYKLSHRISKIALAGPFAPLDVPGVTNGMSAAGSGLFALAQTNPSELRTTFAAIAPTPEALTEAMYGSLCTADKQLYKARQAEFHIEYSKTLRTGIEGIASDFVLISQSWGFPLETIKTETHLWGGTQDCNTPPAMTTYLASVLPNSQTFMLEGEGHCALYAHWDEVLARLV